VSVGWCYGVLWLRDKGGSGKLKYVPCFSISIANGG
jgi:hypothetical protein